VRRRIDVHHHLLPPRYASWLRAQGVDAAGGRELPAWSAEDTLAMMDERGIEKAIASVSAPGVHPDPSKRDELFAELERRRAVVFVHPSVPPGPSVPGIPPFAADFLLDTTRAAYRLVQRETPRRFPKLPIILSHAGGFVPYASYRLTAGIIAEGKRAGPDILEDFRSFYFDTAISGTPAALPSLLAFAKPGHVLFGSDWPFLPAPAIALFTGLLDGFASLDAAGHAAIDRGNAAALLGEGC